MENDPISIIIAADENGEAAGQFYFDDGITHDYQHKNEFILANIKFSDNLISYRFSLIKIPHVLTKIFVKKLITFVCTPFSFLTVQISKIAKKTKEISKLGQKKGVK